MKSYHIVAVMLLMFLGIGSCKKDHHQTRFADPDWKTDTSALYPYSMTAVVQLPEYLQKDVKDGDKMASFMGNDCRGTGVIIKRDSIASVFYILIRGSASEQSKISFRYYSSKNSYLFTTDEFLDFAVDDNYGIVDNPAMPEFKEMD